jgi:hypothetical protein
VHTIDRHITDVTLCVFEPHTYRVGNRHPKRDILIIRPNVSGPPDGVHRLGLVKLGKVSIGPTIELIWPCMQQISCIVGDIDLVFSLAG